MREYQECTWAEEVAQILKANKEFPDEQCMKEVRPKYRAQFTFNNTTGEPNIHMDLLQHAANRLESLQYNIPLYISGNRGTTSIQNLQDVSVS